MGAARAGDHALEVASANWHASAAFVALKAERGVLIDTGSTATDLVRFGDGRVQYQGYTDGERLRSEESIPAPSAPRSWRGRSGLPFVAEWQA